MSMEEEDDIPQLSASTFAALQEFYKEQEEREVKETNVKALVSNGDVFDEDWQLSQFWYDESTIEGLVKLTISTVGPNAKIALISCPTLYRKMKEMAGAGAEVTLFEFDQRFASYGVDYVFYDYKSPLSIPRDRSSYYDIVLADPPFLSEECLTKTAVTMKFLTKRKILLCTGAVMEDLARRLLDLKKNKFEPKHRNNLANDFCCFTNFNIDNGIS